MIFHLYSLSLGQDKREIDQINMNNFEYMNQLKKFRSIDNFNKFCSEMKIQKKPLLRWQVTQNILDKKPHILNPVKLQGRAQSNRCVMGLPQTMIDETQPRMVKLLSKVIRNVHRGNENAGKIEKIQQNKMHQTLITKTKQLFRPLQKHKSVLETRLSVCEEQIQKRPQKPQISEHSSQKALNILQKIILKQTDFYIKQKAVIQLQASRLPIIQPRQTKRKQSFKGLELHNSSTNQIFFKYDTLQPKPHHTKTPRPIRKQKPYFSGWQITQPSEL